jgi:hypothetical protein
MLWPEGVPKDARGEDSVILDVFQPWLERSDSGEFARMLARARSGELVVARLAEMQHAGQDHGSHRHPSRQEIEAAAVEKEEHYPMRGFAEHLLEVLVSKKLLEARQLTDAVGVLEMTGNRSEGPRIVARAWVDPAFRALLLEDAEKAVAQLGLKSSNYVMDTSTHPGGPGQVRSYAHGHTVLRAVMNTPNEHNLVRHKGEVKYCVGTRRVKPRSHNCCCPGCLHPVQLLPGRHPRHVTKVLTNEECLPPPSHQTKR